MAGRGTVGRACVTVTLRAADGSPGREVTLWESQFDDAAALRALKARLDALVKRVSGGEVD